MHNLDRAIDNLHKNIVNIPDRRVLNTTARNDIGSAANSNITDAEVEEQNKRKINDYNLELGSKAHRYRMLVSGKYRDTCDKDKIVAEWKALSNRLEAAVHDSRVSKLELIPEEYLICQSKYCKSLYVYTYLIRPWLDKDIIFATCVLLYT